VAAAKFLRGAGLVAALMLLMYIGSMLHTMVTSKI
jgi:hypothetical protein